MQDVNADSRITVMRITESAVSTVATTRVNEFLFQWNWKKLIIYSLRINSLINGERNYTVNWHSKVIIT